MVSDNPREDYKSGTLANTLFPHVGPEQAWPVDEDESAGQVGLLPSAGTESADPAESTLQCQSSENGTGSGTMKYLSTSNLFIMHRFCRENENGIQTCLEDSATAPPHLGAE